MKQFITKHEWYFWGLLFINSILMVALLANVLFNLFPGLYINFLHCFSSKPLTGNEVAMPIVEYLKYYAIQVGFSFILAFPMGGLLKFTGYVED